MGLWRYIHLVCLSLLFWLTSRVCLQQTCGRKLTAFSCRLLFRLVFASFYFSWALKRSQVLTSLCAGHAHAARTLGHGLGFGQSWTRVRVRVGVGCSWHCGHRAATIQAPAPIAIRVDLLHLRCGCHFNAVCKASHSPAK